MKYLTRGFAWAISGVLCLAFCAVSCSKHEKTKDLTRIFEVNFDESMGKGTPEWQEALSQPDDQVRYKVVKDLYEKNSLTKVQPGDTPRIPKIFHQIWLGPKSPPSYFFQFREKLLKMHPDWEYKLWTDGDLDQLKLELRDILDASPNLAERSDILRAELLERFGGVYLDVDIKPLKCLTELHQKYDFYAGMEYPHRICTTNNMVWCGISIIGGRAHHPIFKRWKEYIRARWEMVNNTYTSPVERVVNHTYFPFSFSVFDRVNEGNYRNILLPATYFYPLTEAHASKQRAPVRSWREKFYALLEKWHLKDAAPFSRELPETIAVHYWGNSWIPGSSDQMKDLQYQLDLLKKDFFSMQTRVHQMEKEQMATHDRQSPKTAPAPAKDPESVAKIS